MSHLLLQNALNSNERNKILSLPKAADDKFALSSSIACGVLDCRLSGVGNRTADQRHCFRDIDSRISILAKSKISSL